MWPFGSLAERHEAHQHRTFGSVTEPQRPFAASTTATGTVGRGLKTRALGAWR